VRKVIFNSISVRNFLSIGDTPVILDFQPGINIITGKNFDKDGANGAGKSTVAIEAPYFALFGTTIRELNKDLIVNSINKKQCEVILYFSIEDTTETIKYKLTRQIAPSKCSLFKFDETTKEYSIDATKSTIAKTTEYIQKLLNSTGKVFQNSVIMTINDTKPFMAQEKVEKRKFIENILNLEVFSVMLLKARDEYNELRRSYELIFTKKEVLEKSYNLNKQQLELFESNKQKRLSDLDDKISMSTSNIKDLKLTFKEIPENIEETLKSKEDAFNAASIRLVDKYFEISKGIAEIQANIKVINGQIRDIEKVGAGCPTCKRPYAEEDNEHREKCKAELYDKLSTLRKSESEEELRFVPINEKKLSVKKELDAIKVKRDGIRELRNANEKTQSRIEYNEESIKNYQSDKLKIDKETNSILEQTVIDSEETLAQQKEELIEIDKKLAILDCVKFVVSEDGVKSYIVKRILSILNQRLQYYLQKFEAPCFCVFDEFFEEQMIDERKEKKSYYSFSAGERKRIDLACLFAFLDIRRLQGDVMFSHTFYDELIDSSLDSKGIELVLDVLRDRVDDYEESSYIITHRGQAVSGKVDNVICIEKRNGFSNIVKEI